MQHCKAKFTLKIGYVEPLIFVLVSLKHFALSTLTSVHKSRKGKYPANGSVIISILDINYHTHTHYGSHTRAEKTKRGTIHTHTQRAAK